MAGDADIAPPFNADAVLLSDADIDTTVGGAGMGMGPMLGAAMLEGVGVAAGGVDGGAIVVDSDVEVVGAVAIGDAANGLDTDFGGAFTATATATCADCGSRSLQAC